MGNEENEHSMIYNGDNNIIFIQKYVSVMAIYHMVTNSSIYESNEKHSMLPKGKENNPLL